MAVAAADVQAMRARRDEAVESVVHLSGPLVVEVEPTNVGLVVLIVIGRDRTVSVGRTWHCHDRRLGALA
jgi:hypothetical protein